MKNQIVALLLFVVFFAFGTSCGSKSTNRRGKVGTEAKTVIPTVPPVADTTKQTPAKERDTLVTMIPLSVEFVSFVEDTDGWFKVELNEGATDSVKTKLGMSATVIFTDSTGRKSPSITMCGYDIPDAKYRDDLRPFRSDLEALKTIKKLAENGELGQLRVKYQKLRIHSITWQKPAKQEKKKGNLTITSPLEVVELLY